ncbi:MAG TPA: hypothetical protein VI408_02765, partial [Gaiellaceae bacterium]
SVPTGERRLTATEAVYEPSEWVDRFSRAGLVVVEDELYEHTPVGWRSVEELTPPARRALLCAELARGSFADRLRLALRDRRHRGEVRRVTR